MVQGYRVTAVGEVPPETVRVIAQSIRSGGNAPDFGSAAAQASPGLANPGLANPGLASPVFPVGPRGVGDDRPAFGDSSAVSGFGAAFGSGPRKH